MPLSPSTLSDVSWHDDSQSQPTFAQEVSSAVLTQMEPRISTARKQRKRNMPKEDDEILTAVRARLATPPSPVDQNDLFGKTIGMHLKNVPNEQSIYARKLLYEVVIQAELGNLSQASRLDVRAFMLESLYTK